MKTTVLFLVGFIGAMSVGCASANSGAADAGSNDDASTDDGGGEGGDDGGADGGALDPLTWTYIYATYFAKGGTPGHCGNSGCHGGVQDGFLCSTQANCYVSITQFNARVGGKMVDPTTPASSVLIDPANSPVVWFDPAGGNMPQDRLAANGTAVTEITAWIMAGALNN